MLSKHANDLANRIHQLEADRRRHVDAMNAIDRVLRQIGVVLRGKPNEQGDVPAPCLVPAVRHRGRFNQTGLESVLRFVHHRGNPSTAEVNQHWRAEGRKGTANVALLKLMKDGLIRREHDPAIRGSRYRTAQRPAPTNPPPMNALRASN